MEIQNNIFDFAFDDGWNLVLNKRQFTMPMSSIIISYRNGYKIFWIFFNQESITHS